MTAWRDDDVDDDWGLPAAAESSGRPARGVVSSSAENGGGTRVKIRMTKGQLRRLLESADRRGTPDEDVVAEIMSMGTVCVDVAEFRHAAERHRRPSKPKLETIQEDDLDDE